jgi:hypothetical protein
MTRHHNSSEVPTIRRDLECAIAGHRHHAAGKQKQRQAEADEAHRVLKAFQAGRLHLKTKRMRPVDADLVNKLNKRLGGRDDG